MKSPAFVASVLFVLAVAGCHECKHDDSAYQQRMKDWSVGIEKRLNKAEDSISDLRIEALDLAVKMDGEAYLVDPASPSCKPYRSSMGLLYISTETVTPYLNGYKVTLNIGNPSAAAFTGCDVVATWSSPFTNQPYAEWKTTQRQTSFRLADTFKEAAWTPITITIAPCSEAEVSRINLHFNMSSVFMREPTKR